jgi:hypothetical protein
VAAALASSVGLIGEHILVPGRGAIAIDKRHLRRAVDNYLISTAPQLDAMNTGHSAVICATD